MISRQTGFIRRIAAYFYEFVDKHCAALLLFNFAFLFDFFIDEKANMFESRINGVLVKFPRNPYQVQLDYMQKLLESIENKQHAVLESPTGCTF